MAGSQQTRVFAFIAVVMLAIQFPVTVLDVPPAFHDQVASRKFFVSIPQIAVSAYVNNANVPPKFLKWIMAPGLLSYDVHNKITCQFDKSLPACDAPLYISQLDNVFDMTTPTMGRTDVISTALNRHLGQDAQFIQAGSSLTLGAAIISLFYPVRIGILGYGLVLYTIFKRGMTMLPPTLIFAPIFVVATDLLSMFRSRRQPAGATPAPRGGRTVKAAPSARTQVKAEVKGKPPTRAPRA